MIEPPQTLLITGARAPVALHMARLLHGAGHRVVLADTPAHPISAASSSCDAYRQLPPPRFASMEYGRALKRLIAEERIDAVIPTCEEVFYVARAWRDEEMGAVLLAPDIDLLARVHNKHDFIRLAESIGLAVPETTLLQSAADVESVRPAARELVFKPVWSRFATSVLLRPEARALDAVVPTAAAPWIAQAFVEGDEISSYCVARAGEVKALSFYRSLYRAGKGAGVCFEPVQDREAAEFVHAFVRATSWTGQISFDLIREPSGRVLPLECNPRATSGLHFFSDPRAFASAILGHGPAAPADPTGIQGLRLALWTYGLPHALRTGKVDHFMKTIGATRDILDWPGDDRPRRAQWRTLWEMAVIAVRQRTSLQAASTHDIEWNGAFQSSI